MTLKSVAIEVTAAVVSVIKLAVERVVIIPLVEDNPPVDPYSYLKILYGKKRIIKDKKQSSY